MPRIFFDASKHHPELYPYLPFGPFKTVPDFVEWHESRIRSSSANTLFVVMDNTQTQDHPESSGALAGVIGMSPSQVWTELGFVIMLPGYHHTHVTASAIGLLLHYCLDLSVSGGLGLRRVQWRANVENLASVRVAEKLGFVKEGILKWHLVLPSDKQGKRSREGDPVSGPGRNTVVLAMCWVKQTMVDALIN